ncbi:hypothetical protein Tco_1164729 [Tanacetum coccineum]
MNQEENFQVTAHDEKWVPTKERVKISTTNVRLETTVQQKEETFQVIIDNVSGINSYEFHLANKKCLVDAEVFQKILDICPRVQGVEFTEVPHDESTLTFLIDLGYRGPVYKHPSMFVDHMHQPWRTLAAIINKCLSSKSASNDKLRKSKIDILWGMFYRENVDYPELIWEDFAFQIDNRQLKKGRREIMPYLRLKFVRVGEDFQEYGLPIPETMLTEGIKQPKGKGSQGKKTTDTPQATIDVSKESDSEPARKRTSSRRVIKNKVTISADDNIIPDPDIALELGKSMSLTEATEKEAARQGIAFRDTSGVSKKTSLDLSQKLKGIQTLTPEEKLAADTMQAPKASKNSIKSQPHAGGSSEGTGTKPTIPDESTVTPKTSSEGTGAKLRVPYEEKVTSKVKADAILDWGSEQESEYSEEDDENIVWVDTNEEEEKNDDDDDKSIDLEKTDDEEPNDEFVHSEEHVQDNNEEIDDESVHGDKQVNDDEDEEMTNAKDADTRNGDEEITNMTKADAEKTEEVKDDIKKAELPPTSSSLSVSLGFGNQFLNLSSYNSLIGTVKDTTDAEINSLLDVQIQQEIPYIQSPSVLTVHVSVIFEPSVLTSIPKTPLLAHAITPLPPPSVSSISHKDVQELKEADNNTTLYASLRSKIPLAVNAYLRSSLGDALHKVLQKHTKELIQKYPQQVDYKEMIEESVQANIINEVKNQLPKFLPKAVSDFATPVIQSAVKKTLKKTPLMLDQSSSQAQSSLKAAESLSEYKLKTILFDKMDKTRSYLTHDKHQALFDALLNSMSLDDAIASGQADPEKVLRKRDRDDIDPLAGPNQGKKTKRSRTKESEPSKKSSTTKDLSKGKSPAKTSKSGKSVTAEEPVEEIVFEKAFVDTEQTIDDVVNDANQPPDDSTQTKDKDLNKDLFKQPPRPPTPDPEWNKHQVVDDQPEQLWFNNLVSAAKEALTFDELMATPIDFSIIEREYNMEEYFKALIDKLDWNNPEGDRCPFDLTKPLLLKGLPGHLTVAAEYFFNNDLEFLKSSDPKKRHTTSITKTKAAQYEIVGVEYMVPMLWSPTKVGLLYSKDSQCGHGDFVDLRLNDIEDMLLLAVQHKLFQLDGSDIVDFIMALHM